MAAAASPDTPLSGGHPDNEPPADLDEYVEWIVDQAPDLTPETRARLAALLNE